MAKGTDDGRINPEIKRLQEKSASGAANMVGDILNNPKVQNAIKKVVLKELVKGAILMSALLVGLMNLYAVAKQVLGFSWQVETVISIILVAIGLSYLLVNMFTGKK